MNVLELREILSKYRLEKQSLLNDTYKWVEIARKAICDLNEENTLPEDIAIIEKNDKKNEDGNLGIERMVNNDIFNSAYVMMISIVEDYFNKIMKLLLVYDSSRIKVTISGIAMQTSINIVDFINRTKEEMIDKIINERIDSLFYASPNKQLEYMDKALGINIEEKEWFKWIEYKARRDVIIHNNNKVNEVYCNKVKGYGKYHIDDYVSFDEVEFMKIVEDFKDLIEKLEVIIRREYHIPSEKDAVEFFSQEMSDELDKIIDGEGV